MIFYTLNTNLILSVDKDCNSLLPKLTVLRCNGLLTEALSQKDGDNNEDGGAVGDKGAGGVARAKNGNNVVRVVI